MPSLEPRWYVRGVNDGHVYDRALRTRDRGTSFCQTCLVVHADPVGKDWHIEAPDVDTMMCGLVIGLDEGEVRVKPGKNICRNCGVAADKETTA